VARKKRGKKRRRIRPQSSGEYLVALVAMSPVARLLASMLPSSSAARFGTPFSTTSLLGTGAGPFSQSDAGAPSPLGPYSAPLPGNPTAPVPRPPAQYPQPNPAPPPPRWDNPGDLP
jgi:hypothetical protein